ncbi:MAG: UvrD-helicase domain-containing protein [Desulfotomaculales bacterium]
MDILGSLNPAQRSAVEHGPGPLLVLAGAGSGKTRVLTYRIAYLIHRYRVPVRNILAITFTNKAAREMRERVEALLPTVGRDLWVATFHSTCARILRREIAALGYDPRFAIYDEGDQQTLIKGCLAELDLDERRHPPAAFRSAISWAKNWLVGPGEYAEQANDRHTELVARVYRLYQERLQENNALDFDDLLLLTVRLFREHPGVLARWQDRFRYILVDEYQDTNHAQYVLVNLLAAGHRNLFVVGDPDQSIYGWRGADITNILNFERDYPEAKVVKLEQNYRSTMRILDAANSVIRHNAARKEKRLWTAKGEGPPLVVYCGADERAEAKFVADRIRELSRSEGRTYRDFAVLYRTHAQSRVLEEVLLREGIPYTIVGGLRFYERKEIKDIIAYLRVIANPADGLSLVRVINEPRRGIGKVSIQRLFAYARETGLTPAAALAGAEAVPGLTGKAAKGMKELGALLAELAAHPGPVTALVREVYDRTGYWQALVNEGTVEAETRMENLLEFLTVTQTFDASTGGTLGEFLAELALLTDIDRYDERADAVTLMTLHSAKGLEFPVVFLIGMEESIFPHARALYEPQELEEERRLCYVGITRAQERLYLTYAAQRMLYGRYCENEPSRFLEEIPPELTDIWEEDEVPAAAVFVPGDRVRHRMWGEGVVISLEGMGDDAQVRVAFPQQGVKTLLLRYAPLERA